MVNKKNLTRIIFSAVLFVLSYFFRNEYVTFALLLAAYAIIGYDVLYKAIRNVFKGQVFDENFLMAIATIGALILKENSEAVGVMLFYQVGEFFQNYAVNKSRKSIAELMDICPETARVIRDGTLKEIDPSEVKIGEIFVVYAGEKIALDGVVVKGKSSLDVSMLTGESLPLDVREGSEVLSGAINEEGSIEVEAKKEYNDSTAARILDLVENATSAKSKSESFITKFARIYTPCVVIIAALLAFVPPLIFSQPFEVWGYRGLLFLVVSCPCALVISIPLSFFGGIGGASKEGILIKGGNYLEELTKCDVAIFDKTGTLTKGEFEVAEINLNGVAKEELLKVVYLLEKNSTHKIARSIVSYVENSGNFSIIRNGAEDITEISGEGMVGKVDNEEALCGNAKLMKRFEIDFEEEDVVGTVIYAAKDGKYLGNVVIADTVKSDSAETLQRLKEIGISKTIILTGDNAKVAEKIARELKVDEVKGGLLPQDKLEIVEKYINEGRKIIFCGDGINDAPTLARASVGIAMGGLGADSAIEAADIVIMTDEPKKVVDAIKISKATSRIVKENIIFALAVKGVILVLGALGFATMWSAVFADVGVAFLAIINAMRLLSIKKFIK